MPARGESLRNDILSFMKGKFRVLIVTDRKKVAQTLQEILEPYEIYHTNCVNSVKSAIKLIAAEPHFHVCIFDQELAERMLGMKFESYCSPHISFLIYLSRDASPEIAFNLGDSPAKYSFEIRDQLSVSSFLNLVKRYAFANCISPEHKMLDCKLEDWSINQLMEQIPLDAQSWASTVHLDSRTMRMLFNEKNGVKCKYILAIFRMYSIALNYYAKMQEFGCPPAITENATLEMKKALSFVRKNREIITDIIQAGQNKRRLSISLFGQSECSLTQDALVFSPEEEKPQYRKKKSG
ncbi:MAG: hypothetical protein GF398_11300 [Chitinivibrionales bacterium]|nr:hypothetical protein [Chitinivibrionales bacterium]